MKKIVFALVLLAGLGLGGASARELDTKSGAAIEIQSQTDFGWDLDNPYRFGLAFSLPELSLTYDLFGYQQVTNKTKTNDPVGFIDFTLGEVQIRFTNGALPDYNASNTVGLGFNDSASSSPGYFGPLYLQNFRSGILWGNWVFQLGAGGTDYYWDAWHREQSGYALMATSWAYLDTRVQYLRPLVPKMISLGSTEFTDETDYWLYDTQTGESSYGIDNLSGAFGGAMVGAQYVSSEFSTMFKLGTQHDWTSAAVTSSKPNGIAVGWDYTFTPSTLKGFRVMGSVDTAVHYQSTAVANINTNTGKNTIASPDQVVGGVKVGYDIALPKMPVKINSIEPYLGIDVSQPFALGSDPVGTPSLEGSAGFTLHWPGMNGWGYDYLQREYGRTGNVYSGATFAYKLYVADTSSFTPVHSLLVTLYNDADGGLWSDSGAELSAEYLDFANADGINQLKVTAYLDRSIPSVLGGVLTPWTKVYFDNFKLAGMSSRENNLMVLTGLKLKKAIRNVEFDLTYESRNLLADASSTDVNDGYGKLGVVKTSVLVKL